jgi:hypothetical protein
MYLMKYRISPLIHHANTKEAYRPPSDTVCTNVCWIVTPFREIAELKGFKASWLLLASLESCDRGDDTISTVLSLAWVSGRHMLGSSAILALPFLKLDRRYCSELFPGLFRFQLYMPRSRSQRKRGRSVMRLPAVIPRPVSMIVQMAIWYVESAKM